MKHRFLTNNTRALSTHTFDRWSTTGTDPEVKGSKTSVNCAGERGAVQFNERWIEKIQPFGSRGELLAYVALAILKQAPTCKRNSYNHYH